MVPFTHEILEGAVQQAENLHRQGDSKGALRAYTQILKKGLNSGETLQAADAAVIERVVALSILCGQVHAADLQLESLISLTARVGNQYASDYTMLKRAQLFLGNNNLPTAYELLLKMSPTIGDIRKILFTQIGLDEWERHCQWLDIDEQGKMVLFSRLYFVMGLILAGLGQYCDAITALRRGQKFASSSGPILAQQAIVPITLALASALMEKGELAAAETLLVGLEGKLDDIRQPGSTIRWREIWAKLGLLRGNFGSALDELAEVRKQCQAQTLGHAELKTIFNLVHVMILVNQVREATNLIEEIRDLPAVQQNPTNRTRLNILYALASARGRSLTDTVPIAPSVSEMWGMVTGSNDDMVVRQVNLSNDLDKLPQAANFLTFFEDRALTFHWHLGRMDFEGATHALDHLRHVFEGTDSAIIHARLRVFEGMLAYYLGKPEESVKTLYDVRATLRTLGLTPELWQTGRFLGWGLARLNRSDVEQSDLATETDELLASMISSLPAGERAIFLLNKWTSDEEYIAQEINQLGIMKTQLPYQSWYRRLFARWALMKRLYKLILHIDHYKDTLVRDHLSGMKAGTKSSTMPMWLYLVMRPFRQATISFLVLPDRVLLTHTHWLSLDFSVSPLTRIQIRNLVSRWHDLISRANLPRIGGEPSLEMTAQAQGYAVQLAEGLQFSNLLKALPNRIHSLTIIPDDSLHGFPFAALPYADGNLISQFAISIGFEHFSCRPIRFSRQRKSLLAVAVSEGVGSLRPIPGTLKEIKELETWALQHNIPVEKLIDQEATKTAVLDRLGRSTIVHIASHGIFEFERPDHSGIFMASGKDQPEVLNLRELSGLDLHYLRHITLSSCWGADHFVLPGRWIISLPETLYRAGAQSVLGCLWQVDDALAIIFSSRFYRYTDRMPRNEALRRTQLDFIQGHIPEYSIRETGRLDQWSGFTLYGDSGKLRL